MTRDRELVNRHRELVADGLTTEQALRVIEDEIAAEALARIERAQRLHARDRDALRALRVTLDGAR